MLKPSIMVELVVWHKPFGPVKSSDMVIEFSSSG